MRSANRSQSSLASQTPRMPLVPRVVGRRAGARGCRPTSTRCPPATGSGRWSSSGRPAGTAAPAPGPPPPAPAPRSSSATLSATCTVPGCVRRGPRPRHRAVERPVDLDRGRVQLEARMPFRVDAGQVRRARSSRRRARERSRRPPRPAARRTGSPSRSPTARRTAVAHARSRTPRRRTGSRRRGLAAGRPAPAASRPAPPSGTGKPTVCPSMLIRMRHQARTRGVERDVGVPGVAGQQQPGRVPAEVAVAQVGRRGQQLAHQTQTAGPPQPGEDPQAARRARPGRGHRRIAGAGVPAAEVDAVLGVALPDVPAELEGALRRSGRWPRACRRRRGRPRCPARVRCRPPWGRPTPP